MRTGLLVTSGGQVQSIHISWELLLKKEGESFQKRLSAHGDRRRGVN